MREPHPPACTCVDCVNKRLKRLGIKSSNETVRFEKKASIHSSYNSQKPPTINPDLFNSSVQSDKTSSKQKRARLNINNIASLLPLLLIFALSIMGLAVSIFVGSFIPFWILVGFSLLYAIEKWYIRYIRKRKIWGKLYRLLLNLCVLTLVLLLISTGRELFLHQFIYNPLIGSLIFIAELILFVWLYRVVARHSWRWPSMKLTIFCLVVLFVIFAFAGVQPIASYKDDAIRKFSTFFSEQKEKVETKLEQDNSEQNAITAITAMTEGNNETDEDSIASKAIDVVDDVWETSVDDYANKLNQYRLSKGLNAFEFTDDLNGVAELRLKELYTNFSHYSAGNYNEHLAENIAMSTGFLSNSDALLMWQNSPGHNANMLDSSYKYTGYAIGNGYAVQVFTEFTTINGKPQLPPGWYWAD